MGIEISRSNPNLEFPSDDHHVPSEREIFFASVEKRGEGTVFSRANGESRYF